MDTPKRREFLKFATHALMMASLCSLALKSKAASALVTLSLAAWLEKIEELAIAIKRKEITPLQWQVEMERLLSNFALADFLKRIDFDLLRKAALLPEEGEWFQKISFQKEDGSEEKYTFYRYLAGFKEGRSIPPHGHDNLISSFVVLSGELHGRHFERVRDDGDFILIQPTIDQKFLPGNFSTVSDIKNNIHWFTALKDRSFMFDFGVSSLDPNWKSRNSFRNSSSSESMKKRKNMDGRVYLDLSHHVQAGDCYRVARMSSDEAYKTYG